MDEITGHDFRVLRALLQRVDALLTDADARVTAWVNADLGRLVPGAIPFHTLWTALVECEEALTALAAAWPGPASEGES